jgi:hypothetical protein
MEVEMGCIDEEEFLARRTFLYILRGKVAACVSAERVQHAFAMIQQQKENLPCAEGGEVGDSCKPCIVLKVLIV